jgi:hypothetical protein
MYGKTTGFIARGSFPNGSYTNTLYRCEKLISENTYANKAEVYTSMNSFMTCKFRTIKNLKHLNALYIDIDCYKLDLTKEQVIYALKKDYFDRVIPRPTFIIDSGRGIYLIWKIDEDRNALPRWSIVQNYLYDKLKEFGADKQALDAARILRVPGTVNSNSRTAVEIVNFYDIEYTLYDIMQEYGIDSGKNKQRWGEATPRQIECANEISEEQEIELPDFSNFQATWEFICRFAKRKFRRDKSATEKQIKYAIKIAEEKGLELPDFGSYQATWNFIAENRNKPFNNGKIFLEKWLGDIIKLITSRKGENCRRELCLFLIRLWMIETTRDYDLALKKTLEVNSKLDKPFSESYVKSHTQSAETIIKRGESYKYKKGSIIELIGITEEEMQDLMYLNKDTKKERKQKQDKERYERRLKESDKKTKKEEIKNRREKIAEMLNRGRTKKEICEELQISKRTYDNDKIAIKAEGLIKCAEKAVSEVKKTASKITNSISSAIREAVENVKEFVDNCKNKSSLKDDTSQSEIKNTS